MSGEQNVVIAERLWQLFEAREWEAARELLHEEFEAFWPHTGEVFRGGENFIAVQENFPGLGEWHIEVKRIVGSGSEVATEIAVNHDQGVSNAASFFEMKDGKIYRLTEYWVEAGSEEPPAWRARWVDRVERPTTYYKGEPREKDDVRGRGEDGTG